VRARRSSKASLDYFHPSLIWFWIIVMKSTILIVTMLGLVSSDSGPPILNLPLDVLRNLAFMVDVKDLIALHLTCTALRQITEPVAKQRQEEIDLLRRKIINDRAALAFRRSQSDVVHRCWRCMTRYRW